MSNECVERGKDLTKIAHIVKAFAPQIPDVCVDKLSEILDGYKDRNLAPSDRRQRWQKKVSP